MAAESYSGELRKLTEDIHEYLTYLGELGVEGVEAAVSGQEPQPSSAPFMRGKRSEALTTARNAALRRNAAAAAEADISPRNMVSHSTSESVSDTVSGQKEMVNRRAKRDGSFEPPPQETLFGEITPKDEASLPRPGETLEDIHRDIGECTRCPLHQSRTHVVNTEGNPKARLMFIGEAPGADEDAQARPFVGRAGQLLNKIIEAIGMRREDVLIGNVNRCRPPQNRTPTPAEAATCKPFLLREIAVVRPEVIVVLGNTAMKNLLDTKEGITKLRGQFQDYYGIKVMPTFHPAYLLRDPSKKREAWEDMKKVRDYLDGKREDK